MSSLVAAAHLRRSTRRYAGRPVPQRLLQHLLAFAAGREHLAPPGVRVAVVSGREQVRCILARYAGVYGLVHGAPHLLVGLLTEDTELARLDLGYVLEQVVLEATHLGLATCWMTGSYHPDRAAAALGSAPGQVTAAIALGYAREDRLARLHDGALRRVVAAHRRRPLEQIVFAERWGNPWRPQDAEAALVTLLECARLAPSARNMQPWRFVLRVDGIALALVEPAPIDGGIVMAHIALAAQELGREGRWVLRWGDPALAAALALPPAVTPVAIFSR